MKNEPTNTPWLYDKRPAADIGRDEATFDGQGMLVSIPEKRGALTDYERLAQVLYDGARQGEGVWHTLEDAMMLEGLGFPDLAHQIRSGIRHAQKPSQNPCEDDSMEGRKKPQVFGTIYGLDMAREPDQTGYFTYENHVFEPATPPAHDFTDEEIAQIRHVGRDVAFSELARDYFIAAHNEGQKGFFEHSKQLNRYAAIAGYLAETEEG